MSLQGEPTFVRVPELIWENNPDTPITSSALSKSTDLVVSYLDFKYNDSELPFHREGTILMADPGTTSPIRLVLKRGIVFSIINQVDEVTYPNGQYKVFDTGLDDIWITLDNRDNVASQSSDWGVNKQWFVFICDELINNELTKKNSARIIVSESSRHPQGTQVPNKEYNFSEKDTRLIGGFKTDTARNIIKDSVWDIAGKFHTVKSKKYMILDEYAVTDNGKYVYRPLRVSDLDSSAGIESNISSNLNVGGNLILTGAITSTTTEQILIKNNLIKLNSNQTGTPATTLISGMEIERGDQNNYRFIFKELDDTFRIGISGSEQAIATREDSPSTNSGIAIWDNTNKKFNTTAVTISGTTIAGNATTATLATKASTIAMNGGNGTAMTLNWSGQSGQPTWLFGSNDGSNGYVYNPSNFSVNYATNLSTVRANWTNNGVITAVVGELCWKHYGNSHTIFDASASTAPGGTTINNTNSTSPWTPTYPTLMGWNGAQTYGVRVDTARFAEVGATAAVGTNTTQLATTAFVHRITPPIGFVYWQLPGKADPATLYPGTTWSNISSTFAGEFFRAEGGNASSFGAAAQGDAIRNIYGGFDGNCDDGAWRKTGAFYQASSSGQPGSNGSGEGGIIGFDASRQVPTANENRPINRTIRLWERIA